LILATLLSVSQRTWALEIISGVERRRRWRVEEKLRIVAEADEPGACFVEVARRHDLSRGLLWHWRRQVRTGALKAPADQQFLPVQIVSAVVQAASLDRHEGAPQEMCSEPGQGLIEIVLPDDVTVRVTGDVGAASLRRVLDALRG
jgi:transposase